jgi:hypothetical protein
MIRPDELQAAFESLIEKSVDDQLIRAMESSHDYTVQLHIALHGDREIQVFEEKLLPRYAEHYDVKLLKPDRFHANVSIRSGNLLNTYIFTLKETK